MFAMQTAQIKAPNAVDIEVGRRIRQRRVMMGFTQVALAQELGITLQQVQKYEKGINRVGSSRLQAVARFLNVPIAFFFDDFEARQPAPLADATFTVANLLSSDEGLALNRAFFLGLEDYESHFALYPPGAFYQKHLDRFRDDDRRTLSAVFYLNADWQPEQGGALRLYPEGGGELDVLPTAGTLVLFMSAELPHEVLPLPPA